MGLQGRVGLTAVLGVDGRLHDLRVLSGHRILANSAIRALSLWRYAPVLLNGEPVEVEAPIDVVFVLSR